MTYFGQPGIDEGAKILANGLSSMPIRNNKVSNGVFGETIEALAHGFIVNFFPEGEKPGWGRGLRKQSVAIRDFPGARDQKLIVIAYRHGAMIRLL